MKTKYVFLVLVLIGLNAFSQDRIGHVTLLKKNITAIRVTPGTECPEGFKLKNGECVPITTAAKTEGIGHVTLLKKNITAIRVTKGTDCPDGFELKNGECVPITTIAPVAITEGGHVTLLKKNESGTPVTSKVKRTGHVTLLRFTQVYLGGGIFLPSTTTKNGGAVNGIDINLSLYQPIWVWGGKTENTGTSLGINVGGSYTVGNGDYTLDNRYTVYNLQGQSAPPTVVTNSNENTVNQGFKFEGGPQLNIHLGGITVSPIFNVGYLSMTQKSFAVAETLYLNTIEYPYDLLTQKETKTTGLAMIPKLRLTFNITPRIGIWAEGNYILGPQTEVESTRFVLDPTIPSDSYNLGHFQEGQYITTKSKVKYSGLGINAGIVIGLGSTSHSEEEPNNTPTTENTNPIKEEILVDSKPDNQPMIFTYHQIPKNEEKENYCTKIMSPSNSSTQNINEPIKVVVQSNDKLKSNDIRMTIYKISNDKNYWYKDENTTDLMNTNNSSFMTKTFEKETKDIGFKPLELKGKIKDNLIETTLQKGTLSEGAYKMVVVSNCGVNTNNFSVSTSNCNHSATIKSIDCIGNVDTNGNSKYRVCVDYKNTALSGCTNCLILLNNLSNHSGTVIQSAIASTTISNISAIPNTLSAGNTTTICFDATVNSGTNLQFWALGTCSDGLQNSSNPNYENSLFNEIVKPCICDFCNRVAEFDSNQTPNATYNVVGNSLSIHQDWWNMNGTAGTIVASKAEIVSFGREISDDCTKCDKDSNQWGNFISGKNGLVNGSFGNTTNSVNGTTHHTLYFTNSNSYDFDLNISIPPTTTLKCCCEKINMKVRYTYTIKDASGACRMCSAVFEYFFQKGQCPKNIISGEGTAVDYNNFQKGNK